MENNSINCLLHSLIGGCEVLLVSLVLSGLLKGMKWERGEGDNPGISN